MLAALSIRDIVLIERLDIDLTPGMTVLTGETGAGKSILLDALSLALGARGTGALVREGAETGQVTAVFYLPAGHPIEAILRDNAIAGESPLILKRIQGMDGRTRAFVNDQPVGAGLLRQIGARLIEIHGQHDDRALIEPATHRMLLDAFGGLLDAAANTSGAYRAWRAAEEGRTALLRRIEAGRSEAAYLSAAVDELMRLAPRTGEETQLADRRQTMMQAEKIAGDIKEAHEIVSGSASPVPTLASLARRLERKRGSAGALLDAAVAALDRALLGLEETGAALEAAMRQAEFDPQELERTEERLFALRGAARKHNVPVDSLAELATRMAGELAEMQSGEERLIELEAAVAAAEARHRAAAAALSSGRRTAASRLESAVMAELPALRLERAAFMAKVESDEGAPTEAGIDRVEFWVRTNPGARPGPLSRIASGGELSRFLLALKVALADRGSAPTLIFDEIDTAVGGAVSDAIGKRLSGLARGVQVLAVTHAPQVAARADRHLLISKAPHAEDDRVVTRVVAVDGERRREEIARMLAGSVVTDEARAAAERLILGTV